MVVALMGLNTVAPEFNESPLTLTPVADGRGAADAYIDEPGNSQWLFAGAGPPPTGLKLAVIAVPAEFQTVA